MPICRSRFALAAIAAALSGGPVLTQAPVQPVNDLPNPYTTVEDYFKLPEGRTWGSTSAVDVDRDGRSIWVAERCGANSCAGSKLDPILKFDASGALVKSFGAGMFIFPHGIHVDPDGNVWVTDGQGNKERTIGHQVIKFSPEGKVLMRLGKAGVPGTGPDTLNEPNDVITAPNGDIFVADRGNVRIQIFDQEGKFLAEWKQFSRVSGLFIDKNDMLYAADSESSPTSNPGGWRRGMRIGSARDGKVLYFIPDPEQHPTGTSAAEGVAVDSSGNVYGAEVGPKAVKKYTKTSR
jgi:streptogramin lyase